MTNVTIEQAVKGYLVFSAKEGKLFREGRSYLAGKTYHNRYLAIYEKLEDAVVNASQYPSAEGITIYEVSGWGQVTDFGKCKVTEWLKLDQIVAKKEWVALLGKQTNSNYASLRILAAKLSEDTAVLKKLAQDKNQQVRSAVAKNANTPALVLAKLGVASEVNTMAI